ncbi:capsule assembly Wzi family protein [bacterium]|nr:capsule assembly Wzi family protein [bacterium]
MIETKTALGQEAGESGYSSTFLYLDHWAYRYISILEDRGFFRSLFRSAKPYKRIDIAKELKAIDETILSQAELFWIKSLKEEFHSELLLLDSDHNFENVQLDSRVTGTMNTYRFNGDNEIDWALFPEINYSMKHFSVSARGRVDNGILNDTTYSGRTTQYLAARLEDAYGFWQFGKMNFGIGRYAENWSPFPDRSLILSGNPYTYDKINFSFQTKHIAFRSLFAKLDNIQNATRYFSAHRLDIKLNNGMNFGITESVVYGGVNQPIELVYLNPFSIFAAAQLNDKKEANENVALDFFIPIKQFNFKGQLLIDDFILDGADKPAPNRKTSSDRLGFLFGFQVNDIGIREAQINIEYERLGSYTYNVKQKRPWQAYTFLERGLGATNNDQDNWTLSCRYFGFPKFIFSIEAVFAREGERTLQSNDFEDSTFVKLPFPSGKTQDKMAISFNTFYQPFPRLTADATIGLSRFKKYNHLSKNKNFLEASVGINWIIQYSKSIQ